MSNDTWKYGVGGVALLGGVAAMVHLGLIGGEANNAEAAPAEPEFTAEERLELYEAVVMNASARINTLFGLGVIPEAESEEIFTALQDIFANPPEDLVEQIAELNDHRMGQTMYPLGRYYRGESELLEALSSTFAQITSPVVSRDGCITGLQGENTFGSYMEASRQTKPAGVYSMACRDGATVSTLTYPDDGAGVAVTYNFDLNVAYFDQNDRYSRRDCDGNENDCFAVLPFSDLEGTVGLTQAFADRALAEEAMGSIQSAVLAEYQGNAANIHAELDTAAVPRQPAP
jgi:hypothetical protein